jgi:Tol biopolymer transport system component
MRALLVHLPALALFAGLVAGQSKTTLDLYLIDVEDAPDLSEDGKQLAFVSTRSGEPEVWVANRDGSSPRTVSAFTRAALVNRDGPQTARAS